MKTRMSIAAAALAALLLSGCFGADSDDPRRGGFFGYNPDRYEQRLQERQGHLSALEAENARAKAETESLTKSKKQRQMTVAARRKKLNGVNGEIRSLKKQIAGLESKPAQSAGMSEAEKEAKVRSLREQLKSLEAEAEALSRM